MCHNMPIAYEINEIGLSIWNSDNGNGLCENSVSPNATDKLLVTFDYGYVDSLTSGMADESHISKNRSIYEIEEEADTVGETSGEDRVVWRELNSNQDLICAKLQFDHQDFPVHHVQYATDLLRDSICSDISICTESEAEADAHYCFPQKQCFSTDSLENCIYMEENMKSELIEHEESFFDSIEH